MAVHYPERLADTLAAICHASFAEQKEVHTPEGFQTIFEKIFGEAEANEILKTVGVEVIQRHDFKPV